MKNKIIRLVLGFSIFVISGCEDGAPGPVGPKGPSGDPGLSITGLNGSDGQDGQAGSNGHGYEELLDKGFVSLTFSSVIPESSEPFTYTTEFKYAPQALQYSEFIRISPDVHAFSATRFEGFIFSSGSSRCLINVELTNNTISGFNINLRTSVVLPDGSYTGISGTVSGTVFDPLTVWENHSYNEVTGRWIADFSFVLDSTSPLNKLGEDIEISGHVDVILFEVLGS